MSAPTWGDLIRSCAADEWTRGRDTTHAFFTKTLADATRLETHVSHGKERETIGQGLLHYILRTQLRVSEAEFWEAIASERPVARPGHPAAAEVRRPSAQLVHQLQNELRLTPERIAPLSFDDAVRLLREHRSRPR